jgi:hypothetical protein
MAARGIYRIRDGWATQHSVMVKYYDGQESEVPEDQYRAKGYQPSFDELRWKDEGSGKDAKWSHAILATR